MRSVGRGGVLRVSRMARIKRSNGENVGTVRAAFGVELSYFFA